jgi:small-conductance mechanosensitive channel
MNELWDKIFLNNTLRDWSIAFVIFLIAVVVLRILQFVIIRKLKAYSLTTKTTVDDFVIKTIQSSVMPLLYALAFYFAISYLILPPKVERVLYIALLVTATFFIIRIITSFIGYLFRSTMAGRDNNLQREKQAKRILLIVQVMLWLGGLIFLVDNLGYDITTVVAGLGIGGIAIALAAQTILGDLFSYLVIFFDKPFEIGDFIIIQDKMGTVEYIGLKTTRLRALSGEQLVCSNTDLTNSRIHNYKRMNERRVVFSFGVVYSTPVEKLKTIPARIRNLVEVAGNTRFDRAHFVSFGDSSLNFEVVYYVLSSDYTMYMDKQQAINLAIVEFFEKNTIEFAFPTQTLYFNPNLDAAVSKQ